MLASKMLAPSGRLTLKVAEPADWLPVIATGVAVIGSAPISGLTVKATLVPTGTPDEVTTTFTGLVVVAAKVTCAMPLELDGTAWLATVVIAKCGRLGTNKALGVLV